MLHHSHSRALLLGLLALACLSALQARAGEIRATEAKTGEYDSTGLPTYRSDVSEVRVTFFATDQNNRPVENVTKSDFAIVDNELVVRKFRSFIHSNETALDVVLLLDLSDSVASRVRSAIADVLELLAREQSLPADNVAVLFFGGTFDVTQNMRGTLNRAFKQAAGPTRAAVLCSTDCNAPDSLAKLQAMRSGGITPLFDALIFAADFISNRRRADGRGDLRPVLILFSDGADNFSMHSAREAAQAAQDAGVLIYSVDIGADENSAGGVFLQRVSNFTGGRYFPPRFSPNDGAASILNTAVEDLRASYVVTYDLPSRQAGTHALRLLPTHNLNLTFHSRNGYNYASSGE
ncbi:MAG: VWA domain-containing protein [Terriglobales bacterium]